MGRASRNAARGRRVEAVFQHIKIKSAEVFRAKVLESGHRRLKLVAIEGSEHFGLHGCRHGERIAIDLKHGIDGHCIFCGIEICEVSQQKAQRITNAAVAFHDALENLVRN